MEGVVRIFCACVSSCLRVYGAGICLDTANVRAMMWWIKFLQGKSCGRLVCCPFLGGFCFVFPFLWVVFDVLSYPWVCTRCMDDAVVIVPQPNTKVWVFCVCTDSSCDRCFEVPNHRTQRLFLCTIQYTWGVRRLSWLICLCCVVKVYQRVEVIWHDNVFIQPDIWS